MAFPRLDIFVRVLGRELQSTDGISQQHLTRAEARLRVSLPAIVKEFYIAAGAAPELQSHNRLRHPDALDIEDGYLVFCEENQNVVDWGFRLPMTDADPEVWQRNNGDEPAWYSEEMTFSVFIVRMLAFIHGVELSDSDL